jgi:hypothetical protein
MTPTGKADDEVCGAIAAQRASDCGQVKFSLLNPVAARILKLIKPLPDHHGRVTFREPSASNFLLRESKEEANDFKFRSSHLQFAESIYGNERHVNIISCGN